MRLWSLHPKYLDAAGLVALWREGLLARKVLYGSTKGYKHHPQLQRFRESPDPLQAIDAYLRAVADEADRRGYKFDRSKITPATCAQAAVPQGQLDYEMEHLRRKLNVRSPQKYAELASVRQPDPHPLFRIIPGGICAWEIIKDEDSY